MPNDPTYIGHAEPAVIEGLYEQYLKSPESLDSGWRRFFEGFEFARKTYGDDALHVPELFRKEAPVLNLINGYRTRGHLFTKTNPVRIRRKYDDPLTLESFGLSARDLDTVFQAGTTVGLGPSPLREIVKLLDETYCHSVAAEYRYVRDPRVLNWLQTRMESCRNRANFSSDEKMHILRKLTQAVVFEKFMHSRFVGQKRFSIEGVETLIPALDAIVEKGAALGIEEFVIGTAHRGRLNILANILDKRFEQIFAEFEGRAASDADFAGDVKYHLGHSCEKTTAGGRKVRLSLAPNPSHLESVDPVVEGIARARIDHAYGGDLDKIAPILIHGDSSIAGQGIVYEVLQMSLLDGYKTGGTVHVVLNNQVGFTTNYLDARSSTYCTDVGKVTLSPVFHVNGDDVEAVTYVIGLALEFRNIFKRDVFIDILGYRKWGHNEGDEPRFTQPILYKAIAAHPNPLEIYAKQLVIDGVMDEAKIKNVEDDFRGYLEEKYAAASKAALHPDDTFLKDAWKSYRHAVPEDFTESPATGVDAEILKEIGQNITHLPSGPKFFAKIQRIYDDRRKMIADGSRIDWAMGELLAYASLLNEGVSVRLSGQDSERGTFSHRHAVVTVEDSEEEFMPLAHVGEKQGKFSIYNSPLSEYGVLGFEYGYAQAHPESLTVWEAQYGDFANVAQVVMDQFLSSAESKWGLMNGLVLLLPHGFEGQGPEHSSARLERYLSLCADNNMQVVNCTSPANFFHALRRQVHWPFRKPMVVMTPKSLLRHSACISTLAEFSAGTCFREVMDDPSADAKNVERIIFCSGKIYYDLLERKQRDNRKDSAVIRIEQLYPFPVKQVESVIAKYSSAKRLLWVQEEPANMGACTYIRMQPLFSSCEYVTRPASATTATGFPARHQAEQAAILERAFQ
ncbi:2-oxoglutarate dehydrogenase E1 component [candidate division KSB1 bacterium]|nr:MAG: 2-oxoglutarate dehydrogenase E1 component [candidate division KSB1 bacterium]